MRFFCLFSRKWRLNVLSNVVKKKRGRPKQKGSKTYRYELRLTKDEYNRLNNLSESTGETKIDLLLQGFKMVENLKKYQFSDD